MTEDSREPGRIDLRALDEPADPTQAARVISAALARVAIGGGATAEWGGHGRHTAPLLAAAATVLLLVAGLLLFAPRRGPVDEAASLIAEWSTSSHVPTNGELLAAFGGYER